MSTQEQVATILREVKPTKDLQALTDIIEGGYLDSFELMHLITVLCETFGIEISIDEITPENFNSEASISAMVDRLQK